MAGKEVVLRSTQKVKGASPLVEREPVPRMGCHCARFEGPELMAGEGAAAETGQVIVSES